MPLFIVENSQPTPAARGATTFAAADGQGGFSVLDSAAPPADAGAATWAAVSLTPPHPAQRKGDLYVVEERFDPPVDLSTAAPENPDLSPCLQRHDVDWVVSYIAADGTQCRCVYSAADAESVRAAYRSAEMPFVRVWRARRSDA